MLRKIILFIALVLLIGLYALLTSDKVAQNFADGFADNLAESKVSLNTDRAETKFPLQLEYSNVVFGIPLGFLSIPLECERILVQPYPSQLLLNRPSFDLHIEAYGGTVDTRVRSQPFGTDTSGELKAASLDLGRHPHLKNFGIAGLLSAEAYLTAFQDDSMPEGRLKDGSLKVMLDKASIVGGSHFGGRLTLPDVRDIKLKLGASVSDSKLRMDSLALQSSLGSAEGSGIRSVSPQQGSRSGRLGVTLRLSEQGRRRYGHLLERASGIRGSASAPSWELSWTKNEGQEPFSELRPISR